MSKYNLLSVGNQKLIKGKGYDHPAFTTWGPIVTVTPDGSGGGYGGGYGGGGGGGSSSAPGNYDVDPFVYVDGTPVQSVQHVLNAIDQWDNMEFGDLGESLRDTVDGQTAQVEQFISDAATVASVAATGLELNNQTTGVFAQEVVKAMVETVGIDMSSVKPGPVKTISNAGRVISVVGVTLGAVDAFVALSDGELDWGDAATLGSLALGIAALATPVGWVATGILLGAGSAALGIVAMEADDRES